MKKSLLFILPLLFCIAIPAGAVQVSYTLSSLGGVSWEYSYTITNNTIASGLYVFDIYFPSVFSADASNYSKITEVANPDTTNWSTQIFPPSAPDLGGIYDALALNTPIALNQSLSGFSVSFDYSGIAALGAQAFEVYDMNYTPLESGYTSVAAATVPEPGTGMLMGTGLLALIGFRRWMKDKLSELCISFAFRHIGGEEKSCRSI